MNLQTCICIGSKKHQKQNNLGFFKKQQHFYIFQSSLVLPSIFHSPVKVPSLSKSHSSGPMSPEVIAIYSAKTKGCGEDVWW